MIDTIEADDAWCPPTLSPAGFGRTRLAWSMIAADSHRTPFSTSRSDCWVTTLMATMKHPDGSSAQDSGGNLSRVRYSGRPPTTKGGHRAQPRPHRRDRRENHPGAGETPTGDDHRGGRG